jgi:hypothetical protein
VLNGGKYYHIFNGQEIFGICNNLNGPAFSLVSAERKSHGLKLNIWHPVPSAKVLKGCVANCYCYFFTAESQI